MVEHETKLVAVVSNLHIGMITGFHMIASTMSNDWWYILMQLSMHTTIKTISKSIRLQKMDKKF
jgi:hypothetical protein